nr:hypothetical protein [Eubacterium sp.]
MKKNRFDKLLKGAAAAGVAFGGTSIIQGNEVVYANELQDEKLAEQEEYTEELYNSQSEAYSEEYKEIESESEALAGEADSESEKAESTSAATSYSASTEDSEIAAASDSAASSLSTEDSEISSESDAASDSLSEEDSELISTSESVSETVSSEDASLSEKYESENTATSESVSELQSAYISASEAFSESGYEDEFLESLISQINTAITELEKADAEALRNGESLNHSTSGNNYYGYGDTLSNLLLQYYFYQTDNVTEILFSEWDSSGYNTNSVKVTYVDSAGVTQVAYFDYVTTNDNGFALVPGVTNGGYSNNNASVVDGIMVVQKTVQYTSEDGSVLTIETTKNEDNTYTTTYYIDGIACDDDDTIVLNSDGSYTISYTADMTTESGTLTAVVENRWTGESYGNYYTNEDDETVARANGKAYSGVYNNNFQDYYCNTSTGELGVITSDDDGDNTFATLVDEDGNAVTLTTFEYTKYNNKDCNSQYAGVLTIEGQTYYFQNANITDNGDGTYKISVYDNTVGGKWQEITYTLYTSYTASGDETFSPTFVKTDDEVTYTTRDGNTDNDGNFGVKGEYFYSLDDYINERDEYSQQRSELTSASEEYSTAVSEQVSQSRSQKSESALRSESLSKSAAASESESETRSDSISGSALASDSTSDSRSDSLSDSSSSSEAASESRSASLSESVAASDAASASVSESISEKISEIASESESLSIKMSELESQSLSYSLSLSESASDSAVSESNSISTSESISASDSAVSESLSNSTSASDSAVSESLSNSTSASDSAVSESLSNSTSASDSAVSESLSESTSASESTSTSESESASTSTANSTSTGGGGGYTP